MIIKKCQHWFRQIVVLVDTWMSNYISCDMMDAIIYEKYVYKAKKQVVMNLIDTIAHNFR